MKSLRNHGGRPAGAPLVADEVLEFHAGRILLLLAICGQRSGSISGLTKMAKLDFFVRYPDFFEALQGAHAASPAGSNAVEAAMVRHRYGPWDKRYYHVLAYLEARGLIKIQRSKRLVRLRLTGTGRRVAEKLKDRPAFARLCRQMELVQESLGSKTGNELKQMIYDAFEDDVARRPLGDVIQGNPS